MNSRMTFRLSPRHPKRKKDGTASVEVGSDMFIGQSGSLGLPIFYAKLDDIDQNKKLPDMYT